MTTNSQPPHVIIVGGGFGGLYAARGLADTPVQVTILDKHNYHLFRPMLYQVATGLLSADEIAAPIRSIFRRQKNVEVFMDEVIGVDSDKQLVHTAERSLQYDYLILATGIHYNYFGHEEWKDVAPGLDSVDDADRIRGKILTAFEAAEHKAAEAGGDHNKEVTDLLTFVLVGGGTAGVEMAGTIAEMARMALTGDFRHIDPSEAHIILFEAAPRILPSYPEDLSERAFQHLRQIGVDVRTNTKVESVDREGVIVNGQRIGSSTVLWSAGVVASAAGQWLRAETDRAGRVKVTADLSVPGHNNVFVIGDTAAVVAPTRNFFGLPRGSQPLPGVAQPAIQEGKYVARLIRSRVAGKSAPKPFWYWDKGNLAIVGRTFAVADLESLHLSGVVAWLLWLGIHIYFLIGFANRLLVLVQWSISFWTKRRGVRIFSPNREAVASDRRKAS